MIRTIAAAMLTTWVSACASVSLPPDSVSRWMDSEASWVPVRAPHASPLETPATPVESVSALAGTSPHSSESNASPRSSTEVVSGSAGAISSELPAQTGWSPQAPPPPAKKGRPEWRNGQPLLQGFAGAGFVTDLDRSGGNSPPVENSGDIIMPVLGGGGQWKLAGDGIDFGLEGMLSFGWQSNATAIVAGGGGAAIAVDVGLFVFDLYGGPFISTFLGDKTRMYAAVGPLLEWVNYDQDSNGFGGSGSGFGVGGYARAGIEFVLTSSTMLGFGVRWSRSTVDMNNNLGNIDLQTVQTVLTVTQGF
jgi:hypothetical protein